MRARPALGREQFAAQWVEHDGDFGAAAMPAGDRDGKLREAVQEIGGPVERIDDPGVFVAALLAAFLGQEAVRGVRLADGRDQDLLGRTVDFADEVIAALFADGQRADAIEASHDDFACAPRGADRDVEQWMHDLE